VYLKHLYLVAAALLAIASQPTAALAATFGFETINGGQAASQFKVEVIDAGDNGDGQDVVGFKFTNTGAIQSSITDIYFQDGLWYESMIDPIESSAGVSFSQGAKPENLPAGKSITPIFYTTVFYTADSDSPTSKNGVNNFTPGSDPALQEYVTIKWVLQPGQTYEKLLAAISAHEVRIGIHVQAFADGSSASYIAPAGVSPPLPTVPTVPEPLSLAFWGAFGCLGLLNARRRLRSSCRS
jgi:hypothetical protein